MKDIMGLMKQAQAMQQKMADMQAELDRSRSRARPAAAWCSLDDRQGPDEGGHIDASLMNPDEKEIVEDLIVAAANDARVKAERTMQERMAEVTKGLPLPPGLKLF
jgi:DNA-binding YbaB/EbfC family protein